MKRNYSLTFSSNPQFYNNNNNYNKLAIIRNPYKVQFPFENYFQVRFCMRRGFKKMIVQKKGSFLLFLFFFLLCLTTQRKTISLVEKIQPISNKCDRDAGPGPGGSTRLSARYQTSGTNQNLVSLRPHAIFAHYRCHFTLTIYERNLQSATPKRT